MAERTVPTQHGVGLFCDSIPIVYDANFVRAERPAGADVLAAEADEVMERFFHRRVIAPGESRDLAGGFAALGWAVSAHLVMAHTREPDRMIDTSAAREVPLESIAAAQTRGTLAEPHGDEQLARQLLAAKQRVRAAVPTQFFALFEGDDVAAYCELRSEGGLAQIEDVNTLAAHRGRGLGRVIVQHALDVARGRGEQVFIEALRDDWPKELYAKLGFDVVDERMLFLRPPHPLTRLRVRTPRLELRLATVAELRELGELARKGIHDPARMPFGVAWTDAAAEPGFVQSSVDHHESRLRDWSPEDWELGLVAFHQGQPIGVQGLRGAAFGERRTVDTGSWLGRAWQGRGLGTEMRAGALHLAFEGLAAERATSGAIQGNPQSLGVSRKLGYVETGSHVVSPRGKPVEHLDLELRRERFAAPVPVELEGLSGLLPLFGAAA
jgi:RimJ/RimL family protein N-acetyltransferase/ribosomal protein S18 acetylase RimI-like enzyme